MENHIILTLGRSGSNTLRDMLNQSPEVLNFGEVLGHWNPIRKAQQRLPLLPRDDAAYLDWILTSRTLPRAANLVRSVRKGLGGQRSQVKRFSEIRTFGIKDFSLLFHRYGISEYLDERPAIKVIGLERTQVVDRMISNAMLGETGVVEVRGGDDGRKRTLRIDPQRIGGMLDAIAEENSQLDAMLSRLPESRVRRVQYHDLFAADGRQQQLMDKLFEFLGVASVPVQERMTKIIKAPVNEVIENFGECVAAVQGTAHEALLRDAAEAGRD